MDSGPGGACRSQPPSSAANQFPSFPLPGPHLLWLPLHVCISMWTQHNMSTRRDTHTQDALRQTRTWPHTLHTCPRGPQNRCSGTRRVTTGTPRAGLDWEGSEQEH